MSKSEPTDRLVLLRLALEGGEVKNSEFKPELKSTDRGRLVTAGLIEADDRKPPAGGRKVKYLVLTERGWGWLGEHLSGDLPPRANAVKPLQKILACLKNYLDANGTALADLVAAGKPAELTDEQRIEQAYYQISGGKANVRVHLAELRAALPNIPRAIMDATLLGMATRGGVALYPLENPVEIRPQDREAVLRTPSGHDRHVVYIGGTSS